MACPFCAIANAYPPLPPSSALQTVPSTPHQTQQSHAFLILSTKNVLAFLDIMPLAKGHILVTTRDHYEKVGGLGVRIGQELGKWLPVISRVAMRVVFGESSLTDEHHWNIVQNNVHKSFVKKSMASCYQAWQTANVDPLQQQVKRAAQVVPHVHFHIIPRPPLADISGALTKSPSWTMFGRGQREDLDDEEGEELARLLREELAKEVARVKDQEGIDLDVDTDYKL